MPPTVSPPAPASFSVFLSHSMKDGAHVDQVKKQLEALGIRAWLAEYDLRPGTSILAKIELELPKCDAVVFLITTNSVESAYVQQEVGLARAHGKLMVPLVDKRVDKARLGLIGELEWLEIDLNDPSEAFLRVTQFLQSLIFTRSRETEQAGRTTSGLQLSDAAVAVLLVCLGLAIGVLLSSYALRLNTGPT